MAACIEGGVDIVQLREKGLDDDRLVERAHVVRAVCRERAVPFILNDRPDLAQAVDADGVHVGQDDVAPAAARRLVGAERIVGLSTHAVPELSAACGNGPTGPEPVDYLSAGPVTETPTKPGRPGTGLGYVTAAVTASLWPVWVTGGVRPETVGDMIDAGARHFVVVRWLTGAVDPGASARQLRQAIDDGVARADAA